MGNQIDTLSQEIVTQINTVKSGLADAITEKGVETASNATFATMQTNIANIPAGGLNPGDKITIDQASFTNNNNYWVSIVGFTDPNDITFSNNLVCTFNNSTIILMNKVSGAIEKTINFTPIGTIISVLVDATETNVFVIYNDTSQIAHIDKISLNDLSTLQSINIGNLGYQTFTANQAIFDNSHSKVLIFGKSSLRCPLFEFDAETMSFVPHTALGIPEIKKVYKWDLDLTVSNSVRIYASSNTLIYERWLDISTLWPFKEISSSYFDYNNLNSIVYDEINLKLYTMSAYGRIYMWNFSNPDNLPNSYSYMSTIINYRMLGIGDNPCKIAKILNTGNIVLLGTNGLLIEIQANQTQAYITQVFNYPFSTKLIVFENNDIKTAYVHESSSDPDIIRKVNISPVATIK